jgi:hypothetical protein
MRTTRKSKAKKVVDAYRSKYRHLFNYPIPSFFPSTRCGPKGISDIFSTRIERWQSWAQMVEDFDDGEYITKEDITPDKECDDNNKSLAQGLDEGRKEEEDEGVHFIEPENLCSLSSCSGKTRITEYTLQCKYHLQISSRLLIHYDHPISLLFTNVIFTPIFGICTFIHEHTLILNGKIRKEITDIIFT